MKAIKIYTQESKYYMEDLHTNTTVELTELVDEGKTLKLPENSANRKYCSIKRAEKGVILDLKEYTFGGNTKEIKHAKSKIDLDEYYTEEEKAQLKKLRDKIDAINTKVMERAQKDIKQKELAAALKALDPETLKALMATIEVKA